MDSFCQKSTALRVNNSLSRRKDFFVTECGNIVKWYCCGPTVYDASHMGHARAYMSFDIIRRIMTDYFGYGVCYVMNITDIDDKIIKRARREYLWDSFCQDKKFGSVSEFEDYMRDVTELYKNLVNETLDPDLKAFRDKNIKSVCEDIKKVSSIESIDFTIYKEVISNYIDEKEGHSISDPSIFLKLTQHWEKEFFADMNMLNVRKPTFVLRITEFVAEVTSFIEKLIIKKYAYESNGSVYFDSLQFSKKHTYAKLVPEAVGDINMLTSGEGELTKTESEKRSLRDFVLWKKSKPGEPSWASPWGPGRPGWHIECSVMASHILGKSMDIHSGGYDLKFPHHDNEIAQSEAYFESGSWVKYFLHAGHLTIEGQKMSKSLKNFITIKDALKKNSANQIRLVFLMHQWDGPLDYSENVLLHAAQLEKQFFNFFSSVKSSIKQFEYENKSNENFHNFDDESLKLYQETLKTKEQIHQALCDNFDTSNCLRFLSSLISLTFSYLDKRKNYVNIQVLCDTADFISSILKILGLSDINWNSSNQNIDQVDSKLKEQDLFEKYSYPLAVVISSFRSNVRAIAKNSNCIELLELCDKIRDTNLLNLGIRIEDKEGQESTIKYVSKAILEQEKKIAFEMKAKKDLEKLERKKRLEEEKLNKLKKAYISPEKLFLAETDKYSQFDEKGIPTHDCEGKPLSKSMLKKLQKIYDNQKKIFENRN